MTTPPVNLAAELITYIRENVPGSTIDNYTTPIILATVNFLRREYRHGCEDVTSKAQMCLDHNQKLIDELRNLADRNSELNENYQIARNALAELACVDLDTYVAEIKDEGYIRAAADESGRIVPFHNN